MSARLWRRMFPRGRPPWRGVDLPPPPPGSAPWRAVRMAVAGCVALVWRPWARPDPRHCCFSRHDRGASLSGAAQYLGCRRAITPRRRLALPPCGGRGARVSAGGAASLTPQRATRGGRAGMATDTGRWGTVGVRASPVNRLAPLKMSAAWLAVLATALLSDVPLAPALDVAVPSVMAGSSGQFGSDLDLTADGHCGDGLPSCPPATAPPVSCSSQGCCTMSASCWC